jgi:uroporphyrinogen-III synthase
MPETVVITRPAQQAQALLQRLAAAGRPATAFPLLEILPLPDESELRSVLAQLPRYALVAFVSPNAIDASLRHIKQWPAGVDIAVVGEGSRKALAAHGITDGQVRIFSPRDRERTDSQTLLEVLDLPALAGRRVLLLRGERGRELLADSLRQAGALVEPVAAYRRRAPDFDAGRRQQLHSLLGGDCTWVITSSEALRNLLAMAAQTGDAADPARLLSQELLVPHIRIEDTARELGFARILRCASGDEELFAKLQLR